MNENRQRCGAKTRSGKPCRQWAVAGRDRCRMHGGTAPRGLAHPSTQHGRFSKDLPTRLAADYEAALRDPELLALREEMALVQAREADLVRRVSTAEAGASWETARKAMAQFRAAQRADDAISAAAALRTLETALGDGAEDYAAWDELLKTIEARRKLADTERRRLEALEQSFNRQQGLLLVGALQDAVRRHVTDQGTLSAIGIELGRILANGSVRRDGEPDG